MKPENLFAFTETKIFQKRIESLTTTETLFALQNELLENPTKGKVIQGTNGARKGRIGDKKAGKGKSGGFRYIYIYLERNKRIYLLLFYSKNEQDELSSDEKKQIASLVKQLKEIYKEQ